jgi:hypothetical protein
LSDPEKQLRDYYARQSMSADRAEAILAQGRAAASQHRRELWVRRSLGIAAAVAVGGTLAWMLSPSDPEAPLPNQVAGTSSPLPTGVNLSAVQTGVQAFFADPEYQLDQMSLDRSALVDWLRDEGAPTDLAVPTVLADFDNLGCRVLTVGDTQVYILCFYLDGVPRGEDGSPMPGKKMMIVPAESGDGDAPPMMKPAALVHLVSVPRDQFAGDVQIGAPVQFSQQEAWNFATWASGDSVYMLASNADPERFASLAAEINPARSG